MAMPSGKLVTFRRKVPEPSYPQVTAETDLSELEKEIDSNRNRPPATLLAEIVQHIGSVIGADGAAIALCDQWGVICRASAGNAPEVGSRLRSDSALTRECFEMGQVVVCEDTETDYRVRRATAKSLRLRSAVLVPLRTQDSVLGVIEVLSSRPSAFTAVHVAGLQRIAALLADLLAQASVPPAEFGLPRENIVVSVPAQSELPEKALRDPVPAVAPPEEPKSRVKALLVAGVALSLLLPLLYFAAVRTRPVATPSTRGVAPKSIPETATEGVTQPPSARPGPVNAQQLDSDRSVRPAISPPGGSPLTVGSPAPSAESTAAVPLASESQIAPVLRPAMPALVIQGVPTGTRIFVDDQLLALANPAGQASASTLAAGHHRLRLEFNDYQNYDQWIDVPAGKTTTITAKLEPRNLPVLSRSATVPVLAVAALPPPVTSPRVSLPEFVLDRTLKGHTGWVTTVAFSPDGQRLASGSWDRTLKFWRVTTGEQLGTVSGKMKELQSLAFSRDGHWLATENSSDTATLRDPATGQEVRAFPSDKPLGTLGSNWVYSIAFSPDGQWLASGVDDKTVRLWDVKTGRKVRDLTGLRRPVIYIAFSPDGRLLATGDDEKTVRIWDARSGEQIFKLNGHKKPVYAVAFSPTGRRLASASADKTVKLWDLTSGREVHTLAGHGNVVTSLAFSPDGRWLASASWDKTIKIWDVETGREMQTLVGHDHPVYSVAFDSRGRWLASGSEDGTIKLWRQADIADQRLPGR